MRSIRGFEPLIEPLLLVVELSLLLDKLSHTVIRLPLLLDKLLHAVIGLPLLLDEGLELNRQLQQFLAQDLGSHGCFPLRVIAQSSEESPLRC